MQIDCDMLQTILKFRYKPKKAFAIIYYNKSISYDATTKDLTYVQTILLNKVENLSKHVRGRKISPVFFFGFRPEGEMPVSNILVLLTRRHKGKALERGLGYRSSAVRTVTVSLDPPHQTSGMKSMLTV